MKRTSSSIGLAVALLFFCSGAFALVYEVLWLRDFALVFGSGGPATAAVLAAYFAGLGLGSRVIGRRCAAWKRPLRSYAILEALVGLSALLVPIALRGYERLYPWLFSMAAGTPVLFVILKTALAFILLGIPTFCMGGTLPVLAQFAHSEQNSMGLRTSRLYAGNTLGGAMGAPSVPFLLLPKLGANGSLWVAALGNIFLALVAWRLSARGSFDIVMAAPPKMESSATREETNISRTTAWRQRAAGLSFVSGLCTFLLQVLWNRSFAQIHENSIYSFAVIVAVFISALALGAYIAGIVLRRWAVLPGAWLFAAILTLFSPWIFLHLTNGLAYLPTGEGWVSYAGKLTALALAVIFVPIVLLGTILPSLLESFGNQRTDPGLWVGRLLAANIIGAVSGSLLGGFVFPAWLGLWNSFFLTGALLAAVGILQLTSKWRWRLAGFFGTGGLIWLCSGIDLPSVKIASTQREQLIAVAEETHGIVAVVERPGSRRLKLNNYYVLGGTSSIGDERMQAHVPLLLLNHSPQRVAFLGLGTGITSGGASFHPIERLTLVELVPEVAAMARLHFREANAAVLEASSTRVILDDARSFLRGTDAKFDVLINDLVVPWREGEGSLFTLEHFRAARQRLADGGIFCVWLPCFQLSKREFIILARTFLSVFPEALVWRGDFSPTTPPLALIGGVEPFRLDARTIAARFAQMRRDPTNPQLCDPVAIWMHFVGCLKPSDLPANPAEINREDRPIIQLSGPMRPAGADQNLLLTGRRLQAYEKEIQKRQPVPAEFGLEAKNAILAGNLLYEYTLLLSEHKEAEAREVESRLRALLPVPVLQALLP